jgi:hypothetical protein
MQEAHRLWIGAAVQFVDGLDELLGADRLGGVEAAIDPNDRLAFFRERMRLILGDVLRARQLLADLPIVLEIFHVLGSAHDRHVLMPSLGRQPDVDQLHAIGFPS